MLKRLLTTGGLAGTDGAATPGVDLGDNVSVRLDQLNEVQPDALLIFRSDSPARFPVYQCSIGTKCISRRTPSAWAMRRRKATEGWVSPLQGVRCWVVWCRPVRQAATG